MKKTLFSVFLLSFACFGSLVVAWSLPSILPEIVRDPYIQLADLLLTVNDFPNYWKQEGDVYSETDELEWGDENLVVRFHPLNAQGYAHHQIFKFRNVASAKYGLFWIKRQGFLSPSSDEIPPNDWSYRSPIADEWYFGCYQEKSCIVLGRYDEFVSFFGTSLNPTNMTIQDLEQILKTIDGKMSTKLELDPNQ